MERAECSETASDLYRIRRHRIIFVKPEANVILPVPFLNGACRRCNSPVCGHRNPVWVGTKYMSLLGLRSGIVWRGWDSFRR
jgi:hypothetical protein